MVKGRKSQIYVTEYDLEDLKSQLDEDYWNYFEKFNDDQGWVGKEFHNNLDCLDKKSKNNLVKAMKNNYAYKLAKPPVVCNWVKFGFHFTNNKHNGNVEPDVDWPTQFWFKHIGNGKYIECSMTKIK